MQKSRGLFIANHSNKFPLLRNITIDKIVSWSYWDEDFRTPIYLKVLTI